VPPNLSPDAAALLHGLLNRDPRARLGACELPPPAETGSNHDATVDTTALADAAAPPLSTTADGAASAELRPAVVRWSGDESNAESEASSSALLLDGVEVAPAVAAASAATATAAHATSVPNLPPRTPLTATCGPTMPDEWGMPLPVMVTDDDRFVTTLQLAQKTATTVAVEKDDTAWRLFAWRSANLAAGASSSPTSSSGRLRGASSDHRGLVPGAAGAVEVKTHSWFRSIDYSKLAQRDPSQPPPITPFAAPTAVELASGTRNENFDPQFTAMALETVIDIVYDANMPTAQGAVASPSTASAAVGASEEDGFARALAGGGDEDDPTAKLFAGFGPEGGDFQELSFET